MPLLDSFSKIFASLSPHRPRHRQPDDNQPTQSRHPSSQCDRSLAQSREVSPSPARAESTSQYAENEFSILLENEDDKDENDLLGSAPFFPPRDTTALPQSIRSYASTFGLPAEYTPTRGQLRSPTSQAVIDPGDRSGDTSQMLKREPNRNDRKTRQDKAEEARLLGGTYNDSNAVRIRPGESKQKRSVPGSSAAFKPTDKISKNSRESGLVRAQGKSQSASIPKKKPPRLEEAFNLEQYNRPNKRQRIDYQTKTGDSADDRPNRSAAQSSLQRRHSPTPSENSKKNESNGITRQPKEIRDNASGTKVPRSHIQKQSPRQGRRQIDQLKGSEDELFTSQAAKQRRAEIEIVEDSSHAKAGQAVKSKISHPRESPDELQGDVTTEPALGQANIKRFPAPQNSSNESPISPSRKRSPSDITPTHFGSSPVKDSKRVKRSHRSSNTFEANYLRFGPFMKRNSIGQPLLFNVDQHKIQLGDFTSKSRESTDTSIMLSYINKASTSVENSRKVTLKLAQKSELPDDRIDIEFTTISGKNEFMRLIQDLKIKIQEKPSKFMDDSFVRFEKEQIEYSSMLRKPLVEKPPSKPIEQSSASSISSTTRQKLSSALQGDSDKTSEESSNLIKSRTKASAPPTDRDGEDNDLRGKPSTKDDESGVEIPVKKSQPKIEPERQTRSAGRRSTRISDLFQPRDNENNDSTSKYPLKEDNFRKEWKHPLVYPQNGKKKAEVTVDDRDRLRDDEFLNDNLIAFYMRFLQDHLERTNKEAAKQIYFFNSYFYDTLTKTPRGQRGINYSGVAKWTRNVDLFGYNYVVVPINQSAHWYVAIICNLPNLLDEIETIETKSDGVETPAPPNNPEPSSQPKNEVHEIPESPEPEVRPFSDQLDGSTESPTSQATRNRLASMSLRSENESGISKSPPKDPESESLQKEGSVTQKDEERDQKETRSADESPVEDNQHPVPTKISAASSEAKAAEPKTDPAPASKESASKKKGKAGQKLDPGQTTIITFDSLDLARSPTIKILRDYICEESVSKRGKGVEPKDIKGMRARQIPLQPNYSDCGLYLLAYLEKFAQDPDQFIAKLLQREMDEKDDWPPLGSGLLRQRLRDFLDQLYQEQERMKGSKKNDQKSLADQQPISHLLGPSSQEEEEANNERKLDEPPVITEKSNGKEEPSKEHPKGSHDSQSESGSDDDSVVDQLSLVPTSTAPVVSNKKSPALNATEDTSEKHSRQKKSEGVHNSTDDQHTKKPKLSEAKPIEAQQVKSQDASEGKRSNQKRVGSDDEIVHIGESRSNRSTKTQPTPKVEVQVRATPPLSPVKVKKSPRATREKR